MVFSMLNNMLTIKNTLFTSLSLYGVYTIYYYIKNDYNKIIEKLRQNIADTNKKVEELEVKIVKINNYLHKIEEKCGSNEKQDYDWFVDICSNEIHSPCKLDEYEHVHEHEPLLQIVKPDTNLSTSLSKLTTWWFSK
jgi:hypothetical protein